MTGIMYDKSYLDKVVLTSPESQCLTFNHGLIGKVLFFYKQAEYTHDLYLKEYAKSLLDLLFENVKVNLSVSFLDGIVGVGWCIQYLLSKQLEEGDADDILGDLDNAIMERDPMRIKDLSFENGLVGIVAYVRARLNGRNSCLSFDKIYISCIEEACIQGNLDFYSEDYDLDNVYKKIIRYYESLPEKERQPWEQELILLERQSAEIKCERNEFTTEQDEYESRIVKSEKSCALIFTQTSRAVNYGVGTYVDVLSQCMISAGWNVCVFELDCPKEDEGFRILKGAGYYKLSQQGISGKQREYNYAQFVIQHFFVKAGHVVCHFNFAIYPMMAERLRASLRAKAVFTLHFTSWSFDLSGDKERLLTILEKQNNDRERHVYKTFMDEKEFMLNNCDHVIAIAQHSFDMIRDVYGIPERKLSLIPNGRTFIKINRNRKRGLVLRRKYGFKVKDQIMVFCGRMDSIKGIVYLMDAFRVLSNKFNNLRLVIIGEGNFKSCLKFADGLWNKITFTGFLEKDKIMEFYEMADFGVVPSIHEEFGFVALEMMMSGLPIIANNTTGLANLTENGKYGLLYNHERALEEDGFLSVAEKVLSGQLSIPVADKRVLENKYSIEAFRKNILNIYGSL